MKKSEIQLLLIVFGILAVVCSWQLIYKNNMAKTEEINTQNVELKTTVDRLEILNGKKDQYIASTEQMKTEGDVIIDSFASGVRIEDQVMYLYNMELVEANEVRVPNVSLKTAQIVPYAGATSTEEGYELQDDGIAMYSLESTVGITTTNNGLKNVLNYIYGMDSRKSLSTVSLTTTEDGYLKGNMQLNFYYLTGTEVPYAEQNISGVLTGTTNVFGSLNGGSTRIGGGQEDENDEAEAESADTEAEVED
ncbi:MAG: hypothetical protein HDR04_19240 [Lachnospiraceae bacterium]|nr:hypothetical protein [Lachnospiraceae bacterium]